MRKKRFYRIIIRVLLTILGAATGADAQILLIAGPDGREVEIRRGGGFRLSLPGRPPVYGGGVLDVDGPRRELRLVDDYSGLMAHAEAVVGDESGRPGHGRVEVYGPWPFGYVAFSGPAWEVESPDEEGEDEFGSPPDEGARPPRPGGGP
jgi:hypothetical protein